MRNLILILAVLLSACASTHPAAGATGAMPGNHKGDSGSQAAEHQPPLSVEAQPPVRGNHSDHPPKKNEHNVEED